MKERAQVSGIVAGAAAVVLSAACSSIANAAVPCGDFAECKVLIEINATDGDIGFHFLLDGDDLDSARIDAPQNTKVFEEQAKGPLREQKLTETFVESAEPLCWADPDADPDEEIVTLEQFSERWPAGTYAMSGKADDGEMLLGRAELTYSLPAAPVDVDFNEATGEVTWTAGDDLGNCADPDDVMGLVADGVLAELPADVPVAVWEVVLEPDVEDEDPLVSLTYAVRLPGDVALTAVTVPFDYLDSLPDDTPVKIEVGAIGVDDNATFAEEDGFCVNEVEGCAEDE